MYGHRGYVVIWMSAMCQRFGWDDGRADTALGIRGQPSAYPSITFSFHPSTHPPSIQPPVKLSFYSKGREEVKVAHYGALFKLCLPLWPVTLKLFHFVFFHCYFILLNTQTHTNSSILPRLNHKTSLPKVCASLKSHYGIGRYNQLCTSFVCTKLKSHFFHHLWQVMSSAARLFIIKYLPVSETPSFIKSALFMKQLISERWWCPFKWCIILACIVCLC